MTTHQALATAALIIMGSLGGGPATGQPRSNAAELEKTAAFERILFGGIRFNNLERVSEALRGGADPNHAKDPLSDMPPLFLAVSEASGKPEIVKLLIEHRANVNARWTPGGSKRKSDADNIPLLMLLLQKAATEQNRDYFPLYWAAMNNNPRGVKVLIDAGADVHAKTGNLGMTALFATHDPTVGEILLSSGAELNAKDARGDTVLTHARKRLASVETSDARELLRPKLEIYVKWLELKGAKE